MASRKISFGSTEQIRWTLKGHVLRHPQGSVTPLLAMAVILMLGTLGFSLDVMRDFQAYSELELAAQSAALYGLSLSTDNNGNYNQTAAQASIVAAIENNNVNTWNKAESGPVNNVWKQSVTFTDAQIQFVNNPLDASESFLQVTAQRNGQTALQHFFIPVLYTVLSGAGVPQEIKTFSTHKVVEVLGQPATQIGAGPPLNTTLPGTRDADFIGFVALPLAISNQQFAAISNPNLTNTAYTIDLVSSKSAEYDQSAPVGHIKGCFVNVSSTGSSNTYYGSGQGDQAIDQLEGLMNYCANVSQQSIAPAVVENGSQLSAFDPADSTFATRQSQILKAFSQLLPPTTAHSFFAVPVLAQDPSFTASNTVIGFAWLSLSQINVDSSGNISLVMNLGPSVPVRNASSLQGFSSVSVNGSQSQMPAPTAPFTPRSYDSNSNGVSIRPRGIVLAPSLSPRQI